MLEHHDAGVRHILVIDGVFAFRPQLALELHPGLEDIEGVAKDAGAGRCYPSDREIHVGCGEVDSCHVREPAVADCQAEKVEVLWIVDSVHDVCVFWEQRARYSCFQGIMTCVLMFVHDVQIFTDTIFSLINES